MSAEELLAEYGYYAIGISTFLEGESIVILGGFAAFRGYLDLYWVMAIAFVGTLLGDSIYFFIGRYHGEKLLKRFPRWQKPADRAFRMLRRYDALFILSFRFLYGLRMISSFVIGTAGISPPRFLFYNAIAAAIWAVSFAAIGYLFGHAISLFLDKLEAYEPYIFLGLVTVIVLFWISHLLLRRRQARKGGDDEESPPDRDAA